MKTYQIVKESKFSSSFYTKEHELKATSKRTPTYNYFLSIIRLNK